MKLLYLLTTLLVLILITTGCQEEEENPNYPIEPSITLESVELIDIENFPWDSLIIVINYRDGDGDLGGDRQNYPHELYTYLPNPQTGEKYWFYDEKDPDLPPYNCADYTFIPSAEKDGNQDTVRANYNRNYYNFNVTLWRKQNGGYEEVDLTSSCNFPLGGIFSLEYRNEKNSVFTVYPASRWEGRIVYKTEMSPQFGNDSLKVSVSIRDEALHHSNTVTSEPFMLP